LGSRGAYESASSGETPIRPRLGKEVIVRQWRRRRTLVIKFVTRTAHRIDAWLHARFGRRYGVLLTVGLIADIVHRVIDAPKQVASHHHVIGIALAVVLELGLLIHQVAEMDERLGFHGHVIAGGRDEPS
jgi:hypothetical protein